MTSDRVERIIELYVNEKMAKNKIAKIFSISERTVKKVLEENGIKNNTKSKITKEQEDYICNMYNKNMTTVEIAKELSVTDATIAKVLRKNNIKIRKAQRRSIVKNHSIFKNIDNKYKAYFLGLIIADGSILIDKREGRSRRVSLSFKKSDIDLLYKFADFIGCKRDKVLTYEKNNRQECYLTFSSEEMVNDLEKYGVVNNKTHSMKFPRSIREDLIKYVILGIFDGDGTVFSTTSNRNTFGFYGTYDICKYIKEYLIKNIGASNNKITEKVGCYMVTWSKKDNIKLFYELMYKDMDVYLKRKKEKFINILIPR